MISGHLEKNHKKRKEINMYNILTLIDIVHIEIGKEHREEAIKILQLTTDEHREDFVKKHKQDKGNICCMILDRAKYELVKEGKMNQNDDDSFGSPDLWE